MKPFEYFKVAGVAQALSLLARYSEKAAILAGGSDLIGMMKDGLEGPKLTTPEYLIDIKEIKELSYIREQRPGLNIGAATTISDIASSKLIAEKYPVLSQAARQVAVTQIRNVATLGGNLCQKPRCWYFRRSSFTDCYRKGGGTCYGVMGENQYNAIIGGHRCYRVHPSDLAVALAALDARVQIASIKATRIIPIEQFYIAPEKNILRETILTPEELVIGVQIPERTAPREGVYLKLKERQAFDFAIVSVAVALLTRSNVVTESRIVFGALAPYPFRSTKGETVLKGKRVSEVISRCCEAALDGARPLSQNGYKVAAAKGLLEQALASLA